MTGGPCMVFTTALLLPVLLSLHVNGIHTKKETAQAFLCLEITTHTFHYYYSYWIVLDQLNGMKWRPTTTVSHQGQI